MRKSQNERRFLIKLFLGLRMNVILFFKIITARKWVNEFLQYNMKN